MYYDEVGYREGNMEENKKYSRFVDMFIDEDDDILVVLGQAPNKKAKYVIEFEKSELDLIFKSYPFREFEGFFANFNDTYDDANNKAYVHIDFKEISRDTRRKIGKNAIPGFRLNLLKTDRALAQKVFNQLTEQALKMEASTKKQESWGL